MASLGNIAAVRRRGRAMSTASASTFARPRPRAAWRSVAIPDEHGGWGLTAEPVLLGLLVAPSWPGALLGVAAFVAFLVRSPSRSCSSTDGVAVGFLERGWRPASPLPSSLCCSHSRRPAWCSPGGHGSCRLYSPSRSWASNCGSTCGAVAGDWFPRSAVPLASRRLPRASCSLVARAHGLPRHCGCSSPRASSPRSRSCASRSVVCATEPAR